MKTVLSPLADFLSACKGQKEVSLVIAKDDAELSYFQTELRASGFRFAESPMGLLSDLNSDSGVYAVAGISDMKDYYDFTVQYPTGQIELWDRAAMQAYDATPAYQNAGVILLVLKSDLIASQSEGRDFLANCGLVYQS